MKETRGFLATTDDRSKIGVYDIKVNLFCFSVINVSLALFAATVSISDVQPVGGFIAGALEITAIDKGFQNK